VATLQKLQDKEREIKQHLKHIQELEWTIDIQEAQKQNLIAAKTISRLPSSPPATSEQATRSCSFVPTPCTRSRNYAR
jgi:hypothetical protein